VFWLGDLNSRMQKDRNQLETMLGTQQQDSKASAAHISFDDIIGHDELKKVIDEGHIIDCQFCDTMTKPVTQANSAWPFLLEYC